MAEVGVPWRQKMRILVWRILELPQQVAQAMTADLCLLADDPADYAAVAVDEREH